MPGNDGVDGGGRGFDRRVGRARGKNFSQTEEHKAFHDEEN